MNYGLLKALVPFNAINLVFEDAIMLGLSNELSKYY